MTDYDDDHGSGFRLMIQDAETDARAAMDQLKKASPNPPIIAKRQAASELEKYRDMLWRYRDEGALDKPWGERSVDVDAIQDCIETTVQTERSLNRRGDASEVVEVPQVAQLSVRDLDRIAKELFDIGKELGFAAPAKDPTPNTDATHEDLSGLLQARGQDQALENFPDSWQPEDVEEVDDNTVSDDSEGVMQ